MKDDGLQPCGHPAGEIAGDDREGTHYCRLCALDAQRLLPKTRRVYNAAKVILNDIDITPMTFPTVEIKSGGVFVRTSTFRNSVASYDYDVLSNSELQELKGIERLVAEGFTMQFDFLIDDALLTGKAPLMSTKSNDST